jgi:hypothetical protein
MATDARGHTIPSGSDYATRKSITDLALTVKDIQTCASESAATLLLTDLTDALSAASLPPISAENPLTVVRTDLGIIQQHDGTAWRNLTQGLYIDSGNNVFSVSASNGTFNLNFNVAFASPPVVVTTDGGQGSAAEYYRAGSAPTTTGIQLVARKNGAAVTGGCRVMWAAIGILA